MRSILIMLYSITGCGRVCGACIRILPALAGFLAATVLLCGCITVKSAPDDPYWHTSPDKWNEPRLYQTSVEKDLPWRIVIDRQTTEPPFTIRVFSPNEAYWFAANADWPDPPVEECSGAEFLMTESAAELYVFTERDYLLRIHLHDHYPNFSIRAGWVNERLLYVRVWWGRILASDVIIDVENERIVHTEMTHSGTNIFLQWHGHAE